MLVRKFEEEDHNDMLSENKKAPISGAFLFLNPGYFLFVNAGNVFL